MCKSDPKPGGTDPKPGGTASSDEEGNDADGNSGQAGCEFFKFVDGRDHAALSPDMGMHIHFEVNESNGYPYGCEGLESFTQDRDTSSRRNRFANQNCGKQMYKLEGETVPMYEIVEEFADNQKTWVDAFIPTMEKMLRNGHDSLPHSTRVFNFFTRS